MIAMHPFISFLAAFLATGIAIASGQSCTFVPKTQLHDGTPANVYFESDSRNCTLNLPEAPLETCDVSDFDVRFSPLAVFPPAKNMWPYVDLNITVIPKVFVSDIFVQLECLSSSHNENVYCKNHSFLRKYGEFYWPCRQHQVLSEKKDVKLPYTFEHACFRMHGPSQYRFNVTILPQRCRLSYLVAMPPDEQVEQRIKDFKNSVGKTPIVADWSPLFTIDANDPNSLVLRFARNDPDASDVTVALYLKESKSVSNLLQKEVLPSPKTEVSIAAPAGEYNAFVYVDHPYCVLKCPEGKSTDCRVCNFTYLNFTLHDHKMNGIQRFKHYVFFVAKVLCYVLGVLIIICLLVVLAMYLYCKFIQPRILRRRPPQAFAMTETPDVLIVYTDDCPEHTASVVAFAELLENHANAHVWIDTKDLLNHSVKPSMWLMRAISEVKFIILVFSAASKQVIAGEALPQRRPFPDLFSPAVRAVTTRINELTSRNGVDLTRNPLKTDSNALDRFIVARFAYTSPSAIPEFFSLLKCRHVVIPQDLGRLFGYLHEVDAPSDKAVIEIDADTTYLKDSMQRFAEYAHDNPDWLKERMKQTETVYHDPREFERLPLNTITEATTVDELAQHYEHLSKPDDDDDDKHADTGIAASSEKFELLGSMNDISSDSD
uniref:SEFIR domain-containing protein n=1 Tax=Panagrellus redivivus TaxID=6233 RepID=A0A7E4VDF7_PANRE